MSDGAYGSNGTEICDLAIVGFETGATGNYIRAHEMLRPRNIC